MSPYPSSPYPSFASFMSHARPSISIRNYNDRSYLKHRTRRSVGTDVTSDVKIAPVAPATRTTPRRRRDDDGDNDNDGDNDGAKPDVVEVDRKQYVMMKILNAFAKQQLLGSRNSADDDDCGDSHDTRTSSAPRDASTGTDDSGNADKNNADKDDADKDPADPPATKRLPEDVATIDDLIRVAEKYGPDAKGYNINLTILRRILPSLRKIKKLVGLEHVKAYLFKQIVFYLLELQSQQDSMLHTVIEGEPGMGKTMLANIMAELYANMGILKKNKVTVARRADMVGAYLGQTTIKTEKLLKKSIGGVLLIDEAYSLGNEEKKDSYAKECIDTITSFLSEHKHELICIVVGYKEALEKCFFAYNSGLRRRFPYRLSIRSYTDQHLVDIFYDKIAAPWTASSDAFVAEDVKQHRDLFQNNGGDVENVVFKVKLAHSSRLLKTDDAKKYAITREDVVTTLDALRSVQDTRQKRQRSFASASMYA